MKTSAVVLLASLCAVVFAVGLAAPAMAKAPTYIVVSGTTRGWHPDPPYIVDVPGKQFVIDGRYLLKVDAPAPFTVTVRDTADCSVRFRFTAEEKPRGHGYRVSFTDDGSATLTSGMGYTEVGGTLEPTSHRQCLDLPATATGEAAAAGSPTRLVILALAALAAVAFSSRRFARPR